MLASLSALAATVALSPATDAQSPQPLRVGCAPTDTYAQAYFAKDMGFFDAAGLDVTVETLASGAAITAALAGGSLDVGCGSPIQVGTAYERGVPFAFFAPGGIFAQNSPTTLLMVAKASPLTKPADLPGKTIAADALGSMTTVAIDAWLAHERIDPTSIKLVEMPFASMGAALDAGRVDAAFIAEPSLTAARAVAREFANPFASIASRFFISSWFATRPWLESNRAVAKKFLTVMQRTSAWANRNQATSGPILGAYTKLSPETLASMRRATYAESLDPSLLQPVLDWAVKGQLLKTPLAADDLIFRA
jgi:NitT/TauT family transport system substrate-binding protein